MLAVVEPDYSDEAELVAAAQAGDLRAFEQLYRLHEGRVHALCWRMTGGNADMAEEMVQDAFVRAWNKLDTFRGDAAFGTWMHRLTANLVLSEHRKRNRRAQMERPMEDYMAERTPGYRPRPGDQHDLDALIARLPERARTVLILHDVEGYQHKEIAEMADMAVGTSKAQLHRARKLLRQWLNDERA